MNAELRREQVLDEITRAESPVSASFLSNKLNVSRQVIVGDVALLRAQGHEIIATARGYTMVPKFEGGNRYLGKVVCQHTAEDTRAELYSIVDLGAVVVNVIVEHEIYGEITGNLNLRDRRDVDIFIGKVESSEVKLLSELTQGVHLHTIGCRDKGHFEEVVQFLKASGVLFRG